MSRDEALIILRTIADQPSDLILHDLVDDLADKLPYLDWHKLLAEVLKDD